MTRGVGAVIAVLLVLVGCSSGSDKAAVKSSSSSSASSRSATTDTVVPGKTTFTAGSAFQHVDAFRTGFFTAFNDGAVPGLNKCIDNGASAAALQSSDSSSSRSSSSG